MKKMETPEGYHLILDIWLKENIEFRKLKNIIAELLMKHKQLILGFEDWEFYPRGESGVFLIAASHCSVHTYPEFKYITVDVYSCDVNFNPELFLEDFLSEISYNHCNSKVLKRGNILN